MMNHEIHNSCSATEIQYKFLCLKLTFYSQLFSFCFLQQFAANNDRSSVATISFKQPFVARLVRIYPRSWHGRIALRAEFYGCIARGMKTVDNKNDLCFICGIDSYRYYIPSLLILGQVHILHEPNAFKTLDNYTYFQCHLVWLMRRSSFSRFYL